LLCNRKVWRIQQHSDVAQDRLDSAMSKKLDMDDDFCINKNAQADSINSSRGDNQDAVFDRDMLLKKFGSRKMPGKQPSIRAGSQKGSKSDIKGKAKKV
jgi:hypothetical protein